MNNKKTWLLKELRHPLIELHKLAGTFNVIFATLVVIVFWYEFLFTHDPTVVRIVAGIASCAASFILGYIGLVQLQAIKNK